jgi:hypothetical protein
VKHRKDNEVEIESDEKTPRQKRKDEKSNGKVKERGERSN